MTKVEKNIGYQLGFGEKAPEIFYQFDKKTVIYPLQGSRGVLRSPITARYIKSKKGGYKIYESSNRIDLYLSKRFWSLDAGSPFAAYKEKGHPIKTV